MEFGSIIIILLLLGVLFIFFLGGKMWNCGTGLLFRGYGGFFWMARWDCGWFPGFGLGLAAGRDVGMIRKRSMCKEDIKVKT